MIRRNSWWKIVVSGIAALILLIFTFCNMKLYNADVNVIHFRLGYFIIPVASSLLIFFLGAFSFSFEKKAELVIGIISYAVSMAAATAISIVFANGFWSSPYIFLVNTGFYIIAAMIAVMISGNMRAGALTAIILSLLFNAVGFIVYCFRGMALTPTDIYAFKTAMSVAEEYTFTLKYQLITGSIMSFAFIMLAIKFPLKLSFLHKEVILRAGAAVVTVFCILLIATVNLDTYNISVFDQYYANRHYGSAFSFYVNTRRMGLEKNDDYDAQRVDSVLSRYTEDMNSDANNSVASAPVAPSEQMPNVVVIMNESFSDLSLVGDFETNEDYLEYFRSLKKNTIRGQLLVSPFGGYTCNSEYEFLTGMNTGLLHANAIPYAQMIFDNIPYSMVTHMKELGYYATALHPFKGNGWNRNNIYRYMGFDKYISYETIKEYNLYPKKIRGYVSDDSDFDTILNYLFGKKDKNRRDFIFNVTMQNHGSYKFSHFEPRIRILNTDKAFPQAEQYLSVIKYTDEALKAFLDTLKQFDEPTIVLMYGDHQPNIESSFFEMLIGKKTDDFTVEEQMRKFYIPFIIWANYDIEEAEGIYTSPCFLSGRLMDVAGLPKSRVQLYLDDLQNEVVQTNPLGYYDSKGNWHDGMDNALFDDYYDMQYAILTNEHLDYDFNYDFDRYIMFNGHKLEVNPYLKTYETERKNL